MNYIARKMNPLQPIKSLHILVNLVGLGERVLLRTSIEMLAPDLKEDPENQSVIRIEGSNYAITKAEYARLKNILA